MQRVVTLTQLKAAGVSDKGIETLASCVMLSLSLTSDKTGFVVPDALSVPCPPLDSAGDLEGVFATFVRCATSAGVGAMTMPKAAEVRKEGGKKKLSSSPLCGLTPLFLHSDKLCEIDSSADYSTSRTASDSTTTTTRFCSICCE